MNRKFFISILVSLLVGFAANAQNSGQKAEYDSKVLENALIQAVQQFEDGEYQKAAAMFEAIVTNDPKQDAAHYYLALCDVMFNELEEAELHLLKAVELDSTNYWYRKRLASLYTATRRNDQAVEAYESILRDFPKKTDTYYDLAELYPATGKLDEALVVLDKIDTLTGLSDASAMTRFQILCGQKKYQEGYDFLIMANEEVESPQIKAVLGDYYLGLDQESLAVALYDEALEMAPGYAPAIIGKAELCKYHKDVDGYFGLLEQLVRDESISAEGKLDYLKGLLQQSEPRFAMANQDRFYALFDAAAETHKDKTDLAMLNVSLRNAFNDYQGVYDLSKKYVELFPDDEAYPELCMYSAYNLKDYKTVLDLSEKQLAKAKASGDKEKIVAAYSSLGDMCHELGDSKKAFKSYAAALKLNPEYAPVLNNYAYYLSIEGKSLKKAEKMSRKTVELEPDNATYLDTFGWILHLLGKDAEALSIFKRVIIYGGKDSAVILNHYADVLEANGKHDLAEMYRKQAASKE